MKLTIILLFGILMMFTDCNAQYNQATTSKFIPLVNSFPGDTVSGLGKNIDYILQDKNDNYWFASNGEGVYRYDGKTMLHITQKDGLCSDFVWTIQEDLNGKIWFTTRDGICCFDGRTFTNYTSVIKNANFGNLKYRKGGLFFGTCFYDGSIFTNFNIHPETYTARINTTYREYAVYCTLVDNAGKIWFGTQEKGVCFYDGKSFSFIDDKDLGGPAVRSIFQDKRGILWFGNNGGGLYRYDGKTLRNITMEKNLGNYEFLKGHKPIDKAGSMARVFAINEDRNANIWIGTADAGVWKYDGNILTNYTAKDGLSGNSVCFIFRNKSGDLWFVSNGDMITRFDGHKFLKVDFK